MTTLSTHVLRAIEDEHRDLAEQVSALVRLLDPCADGDTRAWAARLRGELHHLSPRLERHFQREERHFRLLAGDHPEIEPDLDRLRTEHDDFRTIMNALLARVLGSEELIPAEVAARIRAFSADLGAHERREMEVLHRLP